LIPVPEHSGDCSPAIEKRSAVWRLTALCGLAIEKRSGDCRASIQYGVDKTRRKTGGWIMLVSRSPTTISETDDHFNCRIMPDSFLTTQTRGDDAGYENSIRQALEIEFCVTKSIRFLISASRNRQIFPRNRSSNSDQRHSETILSNQVTTNRVQFVPRN
jgi:hypothetical protein